MLDGSGFVRRSEVFSGAVNEDKTLASMLEALGAPSDALVVMDAGIATEANIAWLRENGYRYLAVSRERTRRFDPDLALAIETRSRQTVHVHKAVDAEGERESWASLRAILEGQQRVTATFRRKDGRTLHVRATRAEPEQQKIFRALGTDPAPGGIRKMIV